MPTMRKLTTDEVRALETKPLGNRAQVAAEYDTYLQEFAAGDYGEVQLDENDNRLTVRNRLQAAAGRRSLKLTFRRTKGLLLRFRVEAATGAPGRAEPAALAAVAEVPEPKPVTAASQEAPPAEAPKRRGRRPRAESVQVTSSEEKQPQAGRRSRSANR